MSDFVVTIDNEKFLVNTNNYRKIKLNGNEYDSVITQLSPFTYKVILNNKIYHITTNKLSNNELSFLVEGNYFESFIRTKLEEEAANILKNKINSLNEIKIISPMPGLILKVYNKIGVEVNKGDPLFLLEAMKMENEIKSPADGIISRLSVEEGSSVEKNQLLLIIM